MDLRQELVLSLIAAKIKSPRLEADIILKAAAPNYPEIDDASECAARRMLARRLQHEPLDKIIGQREFYKFIFKVNKDVLSPRPDTEILVESALELIDKNTPCEILDLGTGSGCILLSLLKERPKAQGTGVDISKEALKVATINAEILEVSSRAELINKSWNEPNFVHKKFDLIVTNPPYIPTAEINNLAVEVKANDPYIALNGGKDGLSCYREIAQKAPLILKKGGYILIEAGINQDKDIIEIFTNAGLSYLKTIPDLANINRCVILKK